jgi:hypothetical protein
MKTRCEVKVVPELLDKPGYTDEHFFRDLAHRLVQDIPLAELHKLIKLTKIDPYSDKSEKVLRNSMNKYAIDQIQQLKEERLILYCAQVDLPEPIPNLKNPVKVKYPIGGYAPGHYTSKCVTCYNDFMGDKYARQCEPCAINMTVESNIQALAKLQKLKNTQDE